ncbi:unnamed protein product [Mytilus edulis]|uniref:Reverse transcriptase domain-containing protein n=1 Tax=Mytilus edulis TaxID=6550 RepID=A0A8S3UIM2_MYTED|nr:unnamed protein product [Mytilus edulis]
MSRVTGGITVTPVLGKVFEYCILPKLNLQNITDLQIGFTKGLNPLISGFIISESKYDQTRKNCEFYMGFLDVKSAFDVVQHDIILDTLLDSNIPSFLWMVIKDLWQGVLSEQLSVHQGATPIHEAAKRENVEVTDLLIRNKADVNATDDVGVTPLHKAAEHGQVEVINVLIRNNAEVNATDNNVVITEIWIDELMNLNFQIPSPLIKEEKQDALEPQTLPDKKHEEYSKQSNFQEAGPYKQKIEKDIKLPWLVDADEFQRMLSHGEYLSYENRLSLGSERGHEVYAKILRGKPDFCKSSDLETRQQILALEEGITPLTIPSTVKVANKTSSSSIKPLPGHFEPQVTSSSLSTVTTELESLEFQELQLQSSILDEVRNGKYKIDIAPSDLIDFGGQKSYDMTHQLFIQHKGSFLLMFDGRYGLYTHLKDYPDGVTASIIKHWVDSILTYTADTDEIMPMILFAATHRDMCGGDTKKMKESFLADIKEIFSSHERKNHIHLETLYFINGVDKNDVEIQKMTDQIVIFAMKQTSWGQRRPMQWVPLELQISNMKMKNINILTKENLQQVNELNADLALNENQMDDFL